MKLEEKQLINSLGSQISKQRQYLQNIVENLMYYYPKWKVDPEVDKNVLHLIYNVYVQADKAKWYLENQKILQFIKNIDNNTGLFGGDRGNFIVGGQSLNQSKFTQGNKKVFESLEDTLTYMNEGIFNRPSRKNPIVCTQEDADFFFGKMQWYSVYNQRFKDAFELLKQQANNKFYRKINDTLGKIMTTIGKALSIGVGIVSAVGVLGVAIAGAGITVPATILAIGGGVATTLKHSGKIGQSYIHGKVTKKWGKLVKELILTSLGIVKIAIGAGIIQRPDILGKVISLFKKGETTAATDLVVQSVQESNKEVPPEVKEQIEEKISEMETLKEQISEVEPEPTQATTFFEEVEINPETGESNLDEVIESIPEVTETDVDVPIEPTTPEVPNITEEPTEVEVEIEKVLEPESSTELEDTVEKVTPKEPTPSNTNTSGSNTKTVTKNNSDGSYASYSVSDENRAIVAANYRSNSVFSQALEDNFSDSQTAEFARLGLTDEEIRQGLIERTEKYNELYDVQEQYNRAWRGKSDAIGKKLTALQKEWDSKYEIDETDYNLTCNGLIMDKNEALNAIFKKYLKTVENKMNWGYDPPDLNQWTQTNLFN